MRAYLCRNIGKGRLRRRAHAMNTSISGTRCLRFLIDRAGRCEDMFEHLYDQSTFLKKREIINNFYQYEKATAEKAIPWIFSIVSVVGIQENRPLIPGHLDLTIRELGVSSASRT